MINSLELFFYMLLILIMLAADSLPFMRKKKVFFSFSILVFSVIFVKVSAHASRPSLFFHLIIKDKNREFTNQIFL